MVDDIRRPEPRKIPTPEQPEDTQNKQIHLETPHTYEAPTNVTEPISLKESSSGSIKLPNFITHATKKQKIIAGIIIAVILVGGAGGVFALTREDTPAPATKQSAPAAAEPAKPTTEASRLTGVQVQPEINKRPVTSIQIENSLEARPQSGLKEAGVIYEAIAEGGITRFNASFLETQPDYIGPVRSVRPYYAALVAPFDPIFVHAGGSADGLAKISQLGLKDLDHGANGAAFQRIGQRAAPHNLYTSTAALDKASQGRGYTSSDVKSLPRKAEQPGQPITAKAIDLNMSSAQFNVHYDYDPVTNSYLRTMAGKPHTDEPSKTQLAPKTVVALVMNYSQNGIYSVYQTTGSGKAVIFQDGVATLGTWNKSGDKEQFTFTGDDGKPLSLNAGQTWFTLVKNPGAITYVP